MVCSLLAHGANPCDRGDETKTPLGQAACTGNEVLVGMLLKARGCAALERDALGRWPLHWAADTGSERVARQLLSAKTSEVNACDFQGATALLLAAKKGHARVVEALLDAGALLRASQPTALVVAAQLNHACVLKSMLERADRQDLQEGIEGALRAAETSSETIQTLLDFVQDLASRTSPAPTNTSSPRLP